MAIKVNGTTVVDDSRNLTNIASIDATTEAAISAAGFSQTTGDITGVTAGSGINGGGSSGPVPISHADTSSQGSINNSGNTVIQDIYVDTYGHITSMSSTTISTSGPTTVGAVGTYASLRALSGSGYSAGSTKAGSSLYYADCLRSYSGSPGGGTWRCMGYGQFYDRTTTWLRIS